VTEIPARERTEAADLPSIGEAAWYTDTFLWEIEKQRIFKQSWQYIGLTSQIPNPGDHFTRHVGHVPLIAVRDEEGEVNAFVNLCRHRGHEVVTEASGSRKTLQCRYHGWTYGLDGSLRVARRSEQDPKFPAYGPLGLFPAKVETWGGLIFANPDVDAPPFSDFFQEWQVLMSEPADFDLNGLTVEAVRHPFEANWKTVVENTLECYHCALCHPSVAAQINVNDDFWWNTYEYFSTYGAATGPEDNQERELESTYLDFASWLWPNSFFAFFPEGVAMIATIDPDPLDTNRSTYHRHYCFPASMGKEARQDFMAFWDQVTYEDQEVCVSVQRGFHTGFYQPGPLMPRSEPGIIHFRKLLHGSIEG
jgi:phenylpropionate dioxygenase-like ring-hydroxylating dioxygenase large terminal subunit